jgi:type I restriction enzyme S subunit
VQIERGGSPRPIDDFITDSPDGLNWVKIGDAPAQGNYITKTAEKIKPEGLSKTREVHPGDLILSNSMSFGKPYIMGIDGCIHDGWLLIRNTYKVFDLTFLCHLLGTPQMIIQYKSLAAGSTVNNLNKELVGNTVVTIPTIKEQRVLGQYLETLDNLITLHQREFAFLCKEKSKKFRYIKNAWEQRKLGELALFNPKDELPQTFEYVDLESVVGTEMLSHRTEVKSSAPSRAQRLAHTGDLFYQTVRPYQKNNYLFEKPDNNYVFSTGYAQMRPYVDGYFLLSLVQSERFVKVVLDNCTGTSYPAINANDLAEIEVAAPSDESEAQKIGTIFRSIDNLITLHQRKPNFYTGGYYAE